MKDIIVMILLISPFSCDGNKTFSRNKLSLINSKENLSQIISAKFGYYSFSVKEMLFKEIMDKWTRADGDQSQKRPSSLQCDNAAEFKLD